MARQAASAANTLVQTSNTAATPPLSASVGARAMAAEICMLELVGSELIKRADERKKRKEDRLKEMREQGGEAPAQ